MVKIDTKVSQELKDQIKSTGKANGRNFCAEIRFALEQYYKECSHVWGIKSINGSKNELYESVCMKCGKSPNPGKP